MATYKVLTKSFINGSIVEEGEFVDYDGKPGSNLELVKAEKGKRTKQESAPAESSVFDEAQNDKPAA